MKEEDEIMRKCGNGNHFTVPEGYFNHLTESIMEQLPERSATKKKQSILHSKHLKPWLFVAAACACIFVGIRFMVDFNSADEIVAQPIHAEKEALSEQEVQTMMKRSMVDDYSLYQDLTEAE